MMEEEDGRGGGVGEERARRRRRRIRRTMRRNRRRKKNDNSAEEKTYRKKETRKTSVVRKRPKKLSINEADVLREDIVSSKRIKRFFHNTLYLPYNPTLQAEIFLLLNSWHYFTYLTSLL
ncbi:hypothetical protein PoB_005568300 [Plakobranchus ocellatus]|uniref:Uncharacterized protein n=1 Tax=Plakobranchus ocellatus TaxID=259542 RepID=A0AAV4CCK6_9GAST|nr:hypothetical protein PoB_005568300 [Plakobranchus ocellatus]